MLEAFNLVHIKDHQSCTLTPVGSTEIISYNYACIKVHIWSDKSKTERNVKSERGKHMIGRNNHRCRRKGKEVGKHSALKDGEGV